MYSYRFLFVYPSIEIKPLYSSHMSILSLDTRWHAVREARTLFHARKRCPVGCVICCVFICITSEHLKTHKYVFGQSFTQRSHLIHRDGFYQKFVSVKVFWKVDHTHTSMLKHHLSIFALNVLTELLYTFLTLSKIKVQNCHWGSIL